MTLGKNFDRWLTTPPEEDEDDDPIHAAGWIAAEDCEPADLCPFDEGDERDRWMEGYNDCIRREAYWDKSGYCVPILYGHGIHERLGIVSERNDGRWDWWRKNSDFQYGWRGVAQGVAKSKLEAMAKILEGWEKDETS